MKLTRMLKVKLAEFQNKKNYLKNINLDQNNIVRKRVIRFLDWVDTI